MKNDFIFKVYNSKRTIFTFQDISLILKETNPDSLKSKIHYYVKKGMLMPVRKGIYAKPEYDPFELATRIYTPSYISLETVLQKEGVVFQYYDTIFVISYLSRVINADKIKISFKKIKDPILLNPQGIIQNGGYAIATKERAFLDALYLYKDYNFDNIDRLNREEIKKLLSIYNSKALEKRAKMLFK